jgi:superfamily II DNA or RNA helicase
VSIDPKILAASYADNRLHKVADRLTAEITGDPSRLDIVTGYLAPSAWGVLGDALDKIAKFRLILGKDYELERRSAKRSEERHIKEMVRIALRAEMQEEALPTKADAEGVRRLLAFLDKADDEVDLRVFEGDGEFLHAKAYILGQSVGVGSANFTASGLVRNRELVAWRQDRGVVADMNAWFDNLWNESRPYKAELREIISSSRFGDKAWTPFDVLIRTLAERYGLDLPKPLEAARFSLKWFQEDAVYRLIRLLRGPAGGALLADAVGLGKTYMALGVIHHFLYEGTEKRVGRRKPILVIVPASMRETWEHELADKGMDWACDLITLQSLRGDTAVADYSQADLVIIDEAHRLRGEGTWFQKAMEIVTKGTPNKRVLLLTATPVHTGVTDLTSLLRLMTKNRRDAWAPAIADFDRYLARVEKREADPFPVLDRSVVRRSRTDILRSLKERQDAGMVDLEPLKLPTRDPRHVEYSYATNGGDLFDQFAATIRNLELAPYDLEKFKREDTLVERPTTASSLTGLFLAGLLKRFESSLRAISISLVRLEVLLTRCLTLVEAAPPRFVEAKRIREFITSWTEGDLDGSGIDDAWDEVLTEAVELRSEDYDVGRLVASLRADLARVASLLELIPDPAHDGKVKRLREILTKRSDLRGKRVLVFTQFRDTAIYLHEVLTAPPEAGAEPIEPVDLIHGGTDQKQRAAIAASFDPSKGVIDLGKEPVRVLVATDVLAEGHNLQLAEAIVNFDLHWNPQVIVQRAGRVDRLNSPHDKVFIYSFLPEEGLDAHLNLASTIDKRFGRIHFLGLGDEAVTKFSQDVQTKTFEQIRRLYLDDASVFDEIEQSLMLGSTDFMRQPLEQFLRETIEDRVGEIPRGVQSVKFLPRDWQHGGGTFIAFRHGDDQGGETIWRFYSDDGTTIVTDEKAIFQAIVCTSSQPRADEPPTKGILIDFDLLKRAATEVADAINRRHATASIARGASERSRRMREKLIVLAQRSDDSGEIIASLLDRLDEVRIEDFDHERGYRNLTDSIREAERIAEAVIPTDVLKNIAELGVQLLGSPADTAADLKPVAPDEMVLVAWEKLVPAPHVELNPVLRAEQMKLVTATAPKDA